MKCFTTISEIARCLGLPEVNSLFFNNVCVDSRLLEKGDLFFALPGERVDGHAFLEDVVQRGAVAAVVCHDYDGACGIPLLRVEDTLHALQTIAAASLRQSHTKVIGITGSIGKTTTKELLATLLEGKYKVARSPKNYNSQIGLPLAILNHLEGDEDYLVQEMGMTGAGQISKLIEIAPPDLALITYIALVHAAFFKDLEDIAAAKAEIFALPTTRMGLFPENIACRQILETTGTCKKRPVNVHTSPFPALPFPGDHIRQNFLLAAAVARECGMTDVEIEARIPYLQLPEKRQQHVVKNGITFVNDSYNACTPSVIAAFNALPAPQSQGKRIAVIGEMTELGRFSEACHKEVGEAALEKVDNMLCLGIGCAPIVEMWKQNGRPVNYFEDRASLVQALKRVMASGDVVLLKGSNSKQLWKILDEV